MDSDLFLDRAGQLRVGRPILPVVLEQQKIRLAEQVAVFVMQLRLVDRGNARGHQLAGMGDGRGLDDLALLAELIEHPSFMSQAHFDNERVERTGFNVFEARRRMIFVPESAGAMAKRDDVAGNDSEHDA